MAKSTDRHQTPDHPALLALRSVSSILGVPIRDVTHANVPAVIAKMTRAIHELSGPSRRDSDHALPGGALETFDHDVDRELDRLQGETQNQVALQARPRGRGESTPLQRLAHELDVDISGLSAEQALDAFTQEIARIKNPSGDISDSTGDPTLSKGDTLSEAIAHNADQRRHLEAEVTRVRGIVGRIAAAMQVDNWTADEAAGIIERVQRWEMLKHELRTRIRDLSKAGGGSRGTLVERFASSAVARVQELEHMLNRLLSGKEMDDWSKNRPRLQASAAPSTAPYDRIDAGAVAVLEDAVDTAVQAENGPGKLRVNYQPQLHQWHLVLQALVKSTRGTEEFVYLMNHVILATLAQEAALNSPR